MLQSCSYVWKGDPCSSTNYYVVGRITGSSLRKGQAVRGEDSGSNHAQYCAMVADSTIICACHWGGSGCRRNLRFLNHKLQRPATTSNLSRRLTSSINHRPTTPCHENPHMAPLPSSMVIGSAPGYFHTGRARDHRLSDIHFPRSGWFAPPLLCIAVAVLGTPRTMTLLRLTSLPYPTVTLCAQRIVTSCPFSPASVQINRIFSSLLLSTV